MTRRARCPACKDNDRGTNPAGRCDRCHGEIVAERERVAAEKAARIEAERADRELRKTCCTDCLAEGREPKKCRPVDPKFPGRRCNTHGRAAKKRARQVAHNRRLDRNFGMPANMYWALYAFQGGKCFICQVSTGKVKNLAVDHDHTCDAGHPKEQGCPKCWRALICGRCNQAIGFLGIEALVRAIQVLSGNGPARQLFVMEVIDDGAYDLPASTESDFYPESEDQSGCTPLNA